MSDTGPCYAEELLAKLIPALIRSKDISEEAILELADELESEAGREPSVTLEERLSQMALSLRVWAIEAAGQSNAEWRAEQARKRIRLIKDD